MTETAELMAGLAKKTGANETSIKGVKIFKSLGNTGRAPLIYKQGMIIVGQGAKRIYLGGKIYEYNPDNYLVMSVPLPAECETFASEDAPFYAVGIEIDLNLLNDIIYKMGSRAEAPKGKSAGLYVTKADDSFRDAVIRLLKALYCQAESEVLGEGLVRELIYRAMCSENAGPLMSLAMKNTGLSKIERALRHIHANYSEPTDVEKLAGLVNMSVSAFHRAFKDVTSMSPIQYVKKIRLTRAKELIAFNGARVSEAAQTVGYESSTQFSREFKRYFNASPVTYSNNKVMV